MFTRVTTFVSSTAAHAGNLEAAVDRVRTIIGEARSQQQRTICFVTGVPGSGKTLVGLRAVHEHAAGVGGQALGAYLSGNGPLVDVLRYAIASDLVTRGIASAAHAKRRASTFIQPVHRFIDELARIADEPPENVVVFDEAQRGWDSHRMSLRQRIPASEASVTLSIMERKSRWSAVIALVGEGQEINAGEAGIEAWFDALGSHDSWRICLSPAMASRATGLKERTSVYDELELDVSVRSPRASTVALWADAVTSGRLETAKDLVSGFDGFPVFLTRDLDELRRYLRDRGSLRSPCRPRSKLAGSPTSSVWARDGLWLPVVCGLAQVVCRS